MRTLSAFFVVLSFVFAGEAYAQTVEEVRIDDGAGGGTNSAHLYADETNNRLGIGDSTPDYNLDVVGTANITGNLTVDTNILYVDSTNNRVGIGDSTPSYPLDVSGDMQLYDTSPKIRLNEYDVSWDWTITSSGADLHFLEGNGTHTSIILETGGDTCIGCSDGTPDYALEVTGTAGKPGGGSWANSSDRRLKTNIEPLTGALDVITKLQGVRFEWVNPEEHQPGVHAGFLAQDVETVFPDWIDEIDPDGADATLVPGGAKIKSLHFPHDFNAYLVEAIRELRDENELLRHEIGTLKQLVCSRFSEEPVCAASTNVID